MKNVTHPRRLAPRRMSVLDGLVTPPARDGRLDPSHGFLARLAAVPEDTVQRALDRLRGLGLLFWQRRLRRDAATGWRCEQASSAYVLTPAACDPQNAAPVEIDLTKRASNKAVLADSTERQAAMTAWAAIAARRMQQLRLA